MVELSNPTFNFNFICREEIVEEIDKLSKRKAPQNTDIPVKITKVNTKILFHIFYITMLITRCHAVPFPTAMKYADVKPIHKKDDKTDKENNRPISILPNLSKIYERMFSEFQCGFRKGFDA